ncbi:MAG: NAD(P)H-binding protein [Phycisphaeraceae bacterium]|nr:NAD(P)H-binding protein [Phycisphaeraceae bacterium]
MTTGTNKLTVAMTGASGFVGRHVARALVARGHRVRALSRSRLAPAVLPDHGVEVTLGDVFDREALARVAQGADAFINLIGIHRERSGGETYQRMHVEATRRCLEAAIRADIKRFVQMSALGTRPEARSEYHRTKREAELAVFESGLDWTIFRPSLIHGAEGEFMHMAKGWVTGKALPGFFLPYFTPYQGMTPLPPASVQPVYVEDVASLFADCLTCGDSIGEIYAVGGPEAYTWPDLLTTIRDHVPDAKPSLQPQGLPAPICEMNAKMAKAMGMAALLPFSVDDVQMSTEPNTCSIAKARAHLGFEPKPFETTLAAYADQL